MPVFLCRVVDEKGRLKEFIREAVSEQLLIRELSRNKFFPLFIKETEEYEIHVRKKKKISKRLIIEFTETLWLLLSSGLTLQDALEVAQYVFVRGRLNEMSVIFLKQIQKGSSMHEAIKNYKYSFPSIYHGLVKIGEKLGSLEGSFKELFLYLNQQKKLKEKIIGSMIYPMIVLSVALTGKITVISFIIPRIKGIFSQIDSVLPARMEAITGFVNSLMTGLLVLIIFTITLTIFITLVKKRGGRLARFLDYGLLKIPFFGKLKSMRESLNFVFAMESLITGGYSVEDALLEASNVIENLSFRSCVLEAREMVLKGESLSSAFIKNPVFPEKVSRWIYIGERAGHVEKAFAQLRTYYHGEVEKWSSRFMLIIEPLLILIIGIIILLFIILFVMPIFSIYGSL